MIDADLMVIFRDETAERLQRLADVLLEVERSGAGDLEAVGSLFRDAHSIRGSAGMFGFDAIGELAAAMEEILAIARADQRIDAREAPGLLAATDAIRAALDGDAAALEPARLALGGALAAQPATRAVAASSESPTAPFDSPVPPAAPTPEPEGNGAASNGHSDSAPPAATWTAAPRTAPLIGRTLRVDTGKVDKILALVGETTLHHARTDHLLGSSERNDALEQELERGDALVAELQDAVLNLRTLPLSTITSTLPRAVRDIAADVGRDVRLELEGTETPLDRAVLEGIAETLVHLLRNALSHGIESPEERVAAGKPRTGRVLLHAEQRGGRVAISCIDDGRGVSETLVRQAESRGVALAEVLAEAGTSTAGEVSALSGRGVGMDAVKRHVEALGGELEVSTTPGRGSTVTMLLPVTLAVLDVLVVERGAQSFALPLQSVVGAVVEPEVHELRGRRFLHHDDLTIPLLDLADAIGLEAPACGSGAPTIVVHAAGARAAVTCDRLIGDQEAVVKQLGPLLDALPAYLGGTMLPDGAIALLLDPAHLVATAAGSTSTRSRAPAIAPVAAPRVLVVDDQLTVRELERTILESAGYRVAVADDGRAALALLEREGDIACVVSDVEMPGLDGLGLLAAIRALPDHRSLPVVIVSSLGDPEAITRGADAGADAWVVKSQFDQQALLETVSRLIADR
jgi:two-component system, chemotaxis family, sensor kinase CheA